MHLDMFTLSSEIGVNFIGFQSLPAAMWLYGYEMIDKAKSRYTGAVWDLQVNEPKDAMTTKSFSI